MKPASAFERIYGAFVGLEVRQDGKAVVARFAARDVERLETDQ